MSEQFEVDALNKTDAIKQARVRVPADRHVSASLIEDRPKTSIYGLAETVSEARHKAHAAVPSGTKIDAEETYDAWYETFTIHANSESSAKSKTRDAIVEKYAKLETQSIDRDIVEGTYYWHTPVWERTEVTRYTPQNPVVWRGLWKFMDQHIRITAVKKIDSKKLPILGFLTPNTYEVEVLHLALVRLTYKGNARYRINVSDDPCKVGSHTWGEWSTTARAAKVGGGLTTAVGVRRCKKCQTSEECSHRFGDWAEYSHESVFDSDQRNTGKTRTCTICGGSQFMHD
jgi:hypothetical protein